MNENAKKWVAALRSGEYSQTVGALRKDDGFCCLGVACDIYSRETGNGSWREDYDEDLDEELFGLHIGERCHMRVLPAEVVEWLGMLTCNGRHPEYDPNGRMLGYVSLSGLNDTRGLSFSELADFIEQHEEELFDE